MSENNNLTYYQRNREKILNKAKDKYKSSSEEDKIKRREYAKNSTKKIRKIFIKNQREKSREI